MTWLENHPRDKFLAGMLAAAFVVVVVWVAMLVERQLVESRQLNGTGLFAAIRPSMSVRLSSPSFCFLY